MNFYGDSFHVTAPGNVTAPGYNYAWNYETANPNRMVVKAARHNSELDKTYEARQVKLVTFQTPSPCQIVLPAPTSKPWQRNCEDINTPHTHAERARGSV